MPDLKSRYALKSIGIVLLVVILFSVDLQAVAEHLKHCDPMPIALAIVLIVPQIAVRAFRWKQLLRWQGISCPWSQVLTIYFASTFAGLMTPGRLGEFAKGFFLKQQGAATFSYSLPSVLVDRMLDLLVLASLALIALPQFYHIPDAGALVIAAVLLLPAMVYGGLRWLGSSNRLAEVASRMKMRLGDNWSGSLDDFVQGSRRLITIKLFFPLGLTILSYGIYFIQTGLIGQAIGLPLGFVTIGMVVAVGILVGYIPITVAGLGTREATLIILFSRVGVPATGALSFAFLYNLVYIACVGLICAGFWLKLPGRHALKSKPAKSSGSDGH
jgi:uncharacterized protein (TIRG00374 family)